MMRILALVLSVLTGSIAGMTYAADAPTVLITGANRGIGLEYARQFAAKGYQVIGTVRDPSDTKELSAVTQRVEQLDVTDAASVAALAGRLHGVPIDILVNNAGIVMPSTVDADNFAESWDMSLAVMAGAQAWAIRAALPSLRRSPHPRIVNIASTEALGATRYISAYTVAKHASMGLTRAMAVELGAEGITVNCVCPGPIRTAMTQRTPEEDKLVFAKRRTVLRRYGEPEEVAHATLSLVLPAAGFITGATLVVDGGLTIRNA